MVLPSLIYRIPSAAFVWLRLLFLFDGLIISKQKPVEHYDTKLQTFEI